jgi:hypothetical protein
VSPVKYELGFYIPEDGIFHSHRHESLKSYIHNHLHRIMLKKIIPFQMGVFFKGLFTSQNWSSFGLYSSLCCYGDLPIMHNLTFISVYILEFVALIYGHTEVLHLT